MIGRFVDCEGFGWSCVGIVRESVLGFSAGESLNLDKVSPKSPSLDDVI